MIFLTRSCMLWHLQQSVKPLCSLFMLLQPYQSSFSSSNETMSLSPQDFHTSCSFIYSTSGYFFLSFQFNLKHHPLRESFLDCPNYQKKIYPLLSLSNRAHVNICNDIFIHAFVGAMELCLYRQFAINVKRTCVLFYHWKLCAYPSV